MQLILPDASETVVRVSDAGAELEHYVTLLLQFAHWAFKTEIERYEAAATQALQKAAVEEELLKIRLFRGLEKNF